MKEETILPNRDDLERVIDQVDFEAFLVCQKTLCLLGDAWAYLEERRARNRRKKKAKRKCAA